MEKQTESPTSTKKGQVRCYTKAMKNAKYLQKKAPDVFSKDTLAEGFGTGVPLEILRVLHRLRHDSKVLNRHKLVAEFLKKNPMPLAARYPNDPLFSGTVHFAQVTFATGSSNPVIPTADMNVIVQYAQSAANPISLYASQYGPNSLSISPTIISYNANIPGGTFSDSNIQGWVNDIANVNHLPANSCVFIPFPTGLNPASGDNASFIADNGGYHGLANIPYVAAGVFHQGLTIKDEVDVYAMVVSHEIAEMVVDPKVDNQNPEVCDPCDLNCNNLTRYYFDASNNFLGSNQSSPPGGFNYAYYICAIVKPEGSDNCPASAGDCQYAPITQDVQFEIINATFAKDQVIGSTEFPNAFYVALDGFNAKELGFNSSGDLNTTNPNPAPAITLVIDSTLNPSLTAAQVSSISSNLPQIAFGPAPVVPIDKTLPQVTQRFLYPYTITFNGNAVFSSLNPDQSAILTLSASMPFGSNTLTADANLELTSGENPYFKNIDTSNPTQPYWLSIETRFVKVPVSSGGTVSRFGVNNLALTADNAASFIASAIVNFNNGNGTAGGESFDSLTQDEDGSAIEFLQKDDNGNFVFNYVLARVRLRGYTTGNHANTVRAFFRLFQAQTTATDFNEQTTYRFASDGALNGHKIPLLGVQNDQNGNPEYVTIPCFASPRVNLSAPGVGMDTQTDIPNIQTISVNPGIEVDTYFGCWLDVNQSQQQFLPSSPPAGKFDGNWGGLTLSSINDVISRSPHQCLVVEIRYDDTPVPAGATPATSDKLAQRNIAWIDGPNPGAIESRRMPHPIEIKASAAGNTTPDELMILWGNTPAGSTASLYLPQINGNKVINLANSLYTNHGLTLQDANTIQCSIGGVTFIPVPVGSARIAGLLSIDLPPGITKGDIYHITVNQLTEADYAPIVIKRGKEGLARNAGPYSWRLVMGAFRFSIVIKTKEQLVYRESRLLSWLLWIQKSIPVSNRWYLVFQRYVAQISGRVSGFGGDPGSVAPSPTGTVHLPKPKPKSGHDAEDEIHFSGKIAGIIYDRYGDFGGFLLDTEDGERTFKSREHEIENLIKRAWTERIFVKVFTERHEPHEPVYIVLMRAPRPFQD